MDTPAVRVTATYRDTPEHVFDAWLDPVLIRQWMFGPRLREEEILNISMAPHVGGTFSFLVRREGQEVDHVGKYLRIERPKLLVFEWGIKGHDENSRVTVQIAPTPTGCELVLIHQLHPKWVSYAEKTAAGWTKMIRVLGEVLLEKNQPL